MNNRKIKIVHISQPAGGGVVTFLQHVIGYLDDTHFENEVISSGMDYPLFNQIGKSIPFHIIDFVREPNPVKDIKALIRIIRLLQQIKPDIVHCHSAKGGFIGRIAARFMNIPVLYTPHAFSYLSQEKKTGRFFFLFLEKLIRPWTTRLLAISTSEQQRSIQDVGFPENITRVWFNSVPNDFMKHIHANPYPFPYICSIGRPSYQKNTEMLIHVMKYLKDQECPLKCLLLGAGYYSPLKNKIQDMIREFGLEENFLIYDWLNYPETINTIYHSKCVVMTSRYEGLPFTIVEAMALGKPVIATNVDGNRDCVFHERTGFVVPLNNVEAMGKYIIGIFNNIELANQLNQNSTTVFNAKFNINNTIHELERIYFELFEA